MKIGLVAVDGSKGFLNLALGKLSAYHKSQGDDVEWAQPLFGEYDIVYKSKIFSFTPDDTNVYNTKVTIFGGTGYLLTDKLPDYIDRLQPDYSIFPHIDDKTAYGFITRGCPNKCHWCCVPTKEGNIKPYMDIDEITQDGKRPKAILMDNNIIACDYGIEQLEKVVKKKYRIDINQASDARLMTEDIAKIYAQIRHLSQIRLGCDTPVQISHCERAMRMIDSNCKTPKQYLLYAMIHGDIKENYERLSYFRNNKRVRIVAQPFRDLNNPHQVIPQWQKDMARWAMRREIYATTDLMEYEPRKGFKFKQYLTEKK